MEKRNYNKVIGRKQENKEIVFGIRPVQEVLHAGKEIEKILIQRDQQGGMLSEILTMANELNIPVLKVPVEKLNSITRKNHQGVICFVSPIIYASLDNIVSETFSAGKTPLILILDRVTDVRNFGAISRTAECMGANCIVIPSRGGAEINSDAVRTSAGALNYIPVCREDNLKDTLNYLRESGIQVVACTEKAEDLIYDVDLSGPIAVLVGSEENGISPEYLKRADIKAKIPQFGKIESLNVSVATAMVFSEIVRQRLLK